MKTNEVNTPHFVYQHYKASDKTPASIDSTATTTPIDIVTITPNQRTQTTKSLASSYSDVDEGVKILNYTLDLIKAGNEQITGKDKEIVLICGDTGAGKSTLVNYLIGNDLIATKPANSRKLHIECPNSPNTAKIGHSIISETFIPQRVGDPSSSLVYWDCPGFEDTRGAAVDIANAFYINKLFDTAQKVRVIIVIEEAAINGARRGQAFKELIGKLGDIFDNKQELVNCMTLVFTKVRDINNFREELTHLVIEDSKLNDSHRDLLLLVIKDAQIATFSVPTLVGSIDGSERAQILNALEKSQYIEKPQVNINVSTNSLLALQKLTEVVNNQIKSNIVLLSKALMKDVSNVKLSELQLIKSNLEKLKQESFESDSKILEFIENEVVIKMLDLCSNLDKENIAMTMNTVKTLVGYFDGFFSKILPDAIVESEKLVGSFLLNTLYPVEQAITREVYKENKEKLDQALTKLEASKQDFKKQLDDQAAQFRTMAQNSEQSITALSKQLQDANQQRVNLQRVYELKENFNALKQAIDHRQNIINNKGAYTKTRPLFFGNTPIFDQARYNNDIQNATNNINQLLQNTQNKVNSSFT